MRILPFGIAISACVVRSMKLQFPRWSRKGPLFPQDYVYFAFPTGRARAVGCFYGNKECSLATTDFDPLSVLPPNTEPYLRSDQPSKWCSMSPRNISLLPDLSSKQGNWLSPTFPRPFRSQRNFLLSPWTGLEILLQGLLFQVHSTGTMPENTRNNCFMN